MELNKRTITKIFEENFAFPLVDTIIGKAIKMDAISAFHFANITGAGYLDDPTYPFSPKGVLKILRSAFQYNIVTGIFDRHNLYYSPTELMDMKPYLFSGDKYLVLVECNNESEFREYMEKVYVTLNDNDIESTDYLFFRIEAWKKGNGMECFLEYLACENFRKKGYIVENQIPLVHEVGSPDFGGFHLARATKGFHIVELAMLKITQEVSILDELDIDHVIVGEAKTATTIMASQLEKYLKTTAFLKGYEMHPEKPAPTKNCFGMLNVAADYSVKCKEPITQYTEEGDIIFDFDEYMEWYQNNLKFYIIANFSNAELKHFVESKKPRGKYNQAKIVEVVLETPMNEIIRCVKEVL